MPKASKHTPSLVFASIILAFIILWRYSIAEHSPLNDYASERDVENYDFVPTEAETKCLQGAPHSVNIFRRPIPNIVHFVRGMNSKGSDTELSFHEFLSIKAALENIQPEAVKLHHINLNVSNEHIQALGRRIQLVQHTPESILSSTRDSIKLPTLLRLQILESEGGILLDTDVFALRPFDAIRHSPHDVVLGYEGGDRRRISGAVILARPGAAFIKQWKLDHENRTIPVGDGLAIKHMVDETGEEVCVLAPTTFFWPTWTRAHLKYMHEPLAGGDVEAAKFALKAHRGAYWPSQLAYRLWGDSEGEFAKGMTTERIEKVDTRFNLLLRELT